MTAPNFYQTRECLPKTESKRIKMVTNLEVLKSSSIVGVIERYIPLRKNGANFIACCPFHSEKSPSFVVSEAKGMFKCFGCGKGGDALSFIKEYEKIDFNEAVKRLSELTGIALEYDKAQRVGKSPHEVLEKINELAKRELAKNAAIVEYLAQRELTQEICEKYDIGLVPSKQILLANFSTQELVESGFANKASGDYGLPRGASTARNDDKKVDSNKNEQSNNSSQATRRQDFGDRIGAFQAVRGDKTDGLSHKRGAAIADSSPKANAITIPMHHRICIAIRNPQHKVVAFVARTHPHYSFPPNAPKYINSKESYFYKKTQILYLYSNAKSSIQAQKAAFVVEGYIDSILLHENGFKNAIATGGTAFNVQHLNLLTRLDCEVIFCFDNDKSGMAANFRAVKVCFGAGFYKVKVAILQNRDSKGKRCKDINEALLAMDSNNSAQAESNQINGACEARNLESVVGGLGAKGVKKEGGIRESSLPIQAPPSPLERTLSQTKLESSHTAQKVDSMDCHADKSARNDREAPKLDFKFLSGYEFFIKWLYKNKDKQQAFNEIKAAISACQNFYYKQEFLDTACKLTGVPQEYFTQDKIPTKQPKDNYSTLIASILHSQDCAYIASELDLSFLPAQVRGSLQVFIAQSLRASALGLESAISAPREIDRPPVLSHPRGLKNTDSSSKILEAAGEQTQGKSQKAQNLNTPQDSRIFDEKAGLRSGEQGDKTGSSIDAVSHKLPALSQKAESILKEFIHATPLESGEFYQHYCDLYLAHLNREQTKARAKKDLKLVLALSEKIAQVQQDIAAQKAF